MVAWPRRARMPPPGRPMLPSRSWSIAAQWIIRHADRVLRPADGIANGAGPIGTGVGEEGLGNLRSRPASCRTPARRAPPCSAMEVLAKDLPDAAVRSAALERSAAGGRRAGRRARRTTACRRSSGRKPVGGRFGSRNAISASRTSSPRRVVVCEQPGELRPRPRSSPRSCSGRCSRGRTARARTAPRSRSGGRSAHGRRGRS